MDKSLILFTLVRTERTSWVIVLSRRVILIETFIDTLLSPPYVNINWRSHSLRHLAFAFTTSLLGVRGRLM